MKLVESYLWSGGTTAGLESSVSQLRFPTISLHLPLRYSVVMNMHVAKIEAMDDS